MFSGGAVSSEESVCTSSCLCLQKAADVFQSADDITVVVKESATGNGQHFIVQVLITDSSSSSIMSMIWIVASYLDCKIVQLPNN